MCNGMAICVDKDGNVRCKYVRSHGDTLTGEYDDQWARLEMLLPDWEHPVLDGEGRLDAWKAAGLLDVHGDLKSKLRESVETWIQEHRVPIMERFLAESGQFGGKASISGHQHQGGQTVTGDQDQGGQTVTGDQHQGGQTVTGDQDQGGQTVKGDQHQDGQTVKGDQHQDGQTVKGDQDQHGQTVKGDQDQHGQTVKGDQDQHGQTVTGDQDQGGQTVTGSIYIDEMVNGPEDVMAHLTAYYAYHERRADLPTLAMLVRWLVSGQVDEQIIND
jgi:hypothetical protein